MKIYLAADHAGFKLKEEVKKFLIGQDYEVEDCGAFSFEKGDDYPDFISKAAEKVSEDPSSKGIVFGKSGTGEEIVANKIKNIRAFAGFSAENVRLAREDNDANVLSLGSEFVDFEKAKGFIKIFLATPFSKEPRHQKRLDEIAEIEEKEEA
ncbi:MAG: RpiB/LacA/LacB family sugar-phosphate isomerase [Patescibacteria group bacterium]|nr:RpiB/LacA/LacB family sugar-phosphate isomerase [Patescibacteria group bacterium]